VPVEQQLLDPSLPGPAKPVSLMPLNSDSSCSGGHAILSANGSPHSRVTSSA
jgi:hypothetical protein